MFGTVRRLTLSTGGGVFVPWTPQLALRPAISAWWDPTVGVTQSGGLVSQWVDRINGAIASASGSSRPSYSTTARNGTPGLIFSGGQAMSFPSSYLPTGPVAHTIAVAGQSSVASGGVSTAISWGSAGGSAVNSIVKDASNKVGFSAYGNDQSLAETWPTVDRFVVSVIPAGASPTISSYVDGGAAETATLSTLNAGVNSGYIGAFVDGTHYLWNGVIQHIIVFNRALTNDERQKLEGWESWTDGKSGSNLPAGHPYRNGPPTIFYVPSSLPATVNYIAEGDSITFGLAVSDASLSYPALAVAAAAQNPPIFYPLGSAGNWWTHSSDTTTLPGDIATSGLCLLTANGNGPGMVPGFATRTGAKFDASKALNIVSVMGGTNDGASTKRLAIYRGIRQFVRLARAAGYQRVIIGTIPSRSNNAGPDNTFDGNTLQINLDIRALWNSDLDADAIMDFALPGGGFDTAANAAPNQADNLHPNTTGYPKMAVPHTAALNAVIAGPGIRTQASPIWSIFDASTNFTLSNSNRTVAWTATGTADSSVRALPGASTGKVYWEIALDNATGVQAGVVSAGFELYQVADSRSLMNQPNAIGVGYGGTNGNLTRATADSGTGAALTTQPALVTADALQFAVDADARLLWYKRAADANWNGSASANPATGTGGVDISGLGTGKLYPAVYIRSNGGQVTSRFKGSEMTGTVPSGFSAVGGP